MKKSLLGFEYIGNLNGLQKCYFCGTDKSVKYAVTILDFANAMPQRKRIYACNKCVALKIAENI